jgi:glycosyltransferase involved in cell wall biosynthesis
MKVSVIIPAYNEEKYIRKCLDSLLTQTYKDVEIIVIDDGSTDKTLKILRDYEKKYENVKILTQKHKGPGEARNLGAKEAKGEILALVDADMEFDERYIEKLIEPIIEGKTIGTAHTIEKIGNEKNIWSKCWGTRRANPEMNWETIGIFRAILKEEFLKTGGFNPKKGYFDDSSPYEKTKRRGLAVKDAICYHNNPSSLREVFNHSKWIGGSIMIDYENLLNLKFFLKKTKRAKKFKFSIIFLLILIISIISVFKILGLNVEYKTFTFTIIVLLPIILIFIFALRRTIRERYPKYLIFLPIFYLIKFLGLTFGAFRQIPNIVISKIQGREVKYKY